MKVTQALYLRHLGTTTLTDVAAKQDYNLSDLGDCHGVQFLEEHVQGPKASEKACATFLNTIFQGLNVRTKIDQELTPLKTSTVSALMNTKVVKAKIEDQPLHVGRGVMSHEGTKSTKEAQSAQYARALDRFLFEDTKATVGACFHQKKKKKKKAGGVEQPALYVAKLVDGYAENPVLLASSCSDS